MCLAAIFFVVSSACVPIFVSFHFCCVLWCFYLIYLVAFLFTRLWPSISISANIFAFIFSFIINQATTVSVVGLNRVCVFSRYRPASLRCWSEGGTSKRGGKYNYTNKKIINAAVFPISYAFCGACEIAISLTVRYANLFVSTVEPDRRSLLQLIIQLVKYTGSSLSENCVRAKHESCEDR